MQMYTVTGELRLSVKAVLWEVETDLFCHDFGSFSD
jgi:hypothetical protein